MNILFAPDWRDGVPYQRLLGEALLAEEVEVDFLRHYRRGFPLARLVGSWAQQHPVDLLHLHWPEAYYPRKGDWWDNLRAARYPLDLTLARRGRALVITAHNLHTHNRAGELFEKRNTLESFSQAQRVIAHSAAAREEIVQTFGIDGGKISVIPHGDLSVTLGAPLERGEARQALGLGEGKVALMFGTIEPYKGLEEVIDAWRAQAPEAHLHIVGRPRSAAYAAELATRAEGLATVHLHPGWLTDEALRQWLSAADCAIMNYRTIFTSGAACLARSYGLPILLPERLRTIVLDEPNPLVRRFAKVEDLSSTLSALLESTTPDYAAAAPWRAATAWPHVAKLTAAVYREAVAARLGER